MRASNALRRCCRRSCTMRRRWCWQIRSRTRQSRCRPGCAKSQACTRRGLKSTSVCHRDCCRAAAVAAHHPTTQQAMCSRVRCCTPTCRLTSSALQPLHASACARRCGMPALPARRSNAPRGRCSAHQLTGCLLCAAFEGALPAAAKRISGGCNVSQHHSQHARGRGRSGPLYGTQRR